MREREREREKEQEDTNRKIKDRLVRIDLVLAVGDVTQGIEGVPRGVTHLDAPCGGGSCLRHCTICM